MKTIEIVVDKDGETTITTKGFVGPKCKDATKFLNALGNATSDKPTLEYHQVEGVRLSQKN